MRAGVMKPAEFQSGSGRVRLRSNESMEHLKKRARAIRNRASAQIGKLADRRLQQLVPWWHERFPTRRLRIIFGNGAEHISIDGRTYHPGYEVDGELWPGEINHQNNRQWLHMRSPWTFKPIDDAFHDVVELTDGYRDGLPGDFVIEPIKTRSKR